VADKRKTAVVYGGTSSEREVSCTSGKAVLEALKGRGFDVLGIDTRGDCLAELRNACAEVAFLALHGGFGENGGIQAVLEHARIPYTGSGPRASRIAMDKPATKRLLIENGVPTPEFDVLGPQAGEAEVRLAATRLGYPVVLKPPADGSSVGVSIVRRPEDIAAALAEARRVDGSVLLEKFIEGRELTVGILNGRPLPIVEIRCPGFYDLKTKYTKGIAEYIVDPELPGPVRAAVVDAALRTYRVVGCEGAARVDVRLDGAGVPYVLEINTIPGLTATSLLPKAARAAGIEFGELCESMVKDALQRFNSRAGGCVGQAATL